MSQKNSMYMNPYVRLLHTARHAILHLVNPERIAGGSFPADKVVNRTGFRLDGLADQIATAKLLGYVTQLEWDSTTGITICFVKAPESPGYPLNV